MLISSGQGGYVASAARAMGLALVAGVFAFVALAAAAVEFDDPEVLVMTNDPAPGTSPAAAFWGFTGAANTACNATGPSPWLVGTYVVISGCAGGSSWTGYWTYSLTQDLLSARALIGEPTPGVPFSDLDFLPFDVGFARTDIDTIAIQGTAVGAGADPSTADGIWLEDSATALSLLARAGINAPGAGSPPDVANGTRYTAFNWMRPLAANGGVVGFRKAIEGAESGEAIWGTDSAGDLILRVLEDEPVPVRGGGTLTFTALFGTILYAMNEVGDILFSGGTATENDVFFSHADGTVSVPPGTRLSDLPAGAPGGLFAYRTLPPYFLDESEGLHAIAQFDGAFEGVLVPGAGATPTAVMIEGDPAPTPGGNEEFDELQTTSLNYGASGHAAITAELLDTVTFQTRLSVWQIAPGAVLDYVVGEGDAVAITNPEDLPANTSGAPFGEWRYDNLGCGFWCGGDRHPIPDNQGGVLFGAELSEGLSSTKFEALFHKDAAGQVQLVIKEGDQIPLDGETAPLSRPLFTDVAYPALPLNENGLVFRATLFPPSGVTEAIVYLPEPARATGVACGFLLLMGLGWHRRH